MSELESLRVQVANQELTILRLRARASDLAAQVANLVGIKNTQQRLIDALRRQIGGSAVERAEAAFRGRK